MSDKSFGESVAFVLGTRLDLIGLFCPSCAADRMRATLAMVDEIRYVETVATTGAHARCVSCSRFPLVMSAQELLRPSVLLDFMGRVLRMAEMIAAESQR